MLALEGGYVGPGVSEAVVECLKVIMSDDNDDDDDDDDVDDNENGSRCYWVTPTPQSPALSWSGSPASRPPWTSPTPSPTW